MSIELIVPEVGCGRIMTPHEVNLFVQIAWGNTRDFLKREPVPPVIPPFPPEYWGSLLRPDDIEKACVFRLATLRAVVAVRYRHKLRFFEPINSCSFELENHAFLWCLKITSPSPCIIPQFSPDEAFRGFVDKALA